MNQAQMKNAASTESLVARAADAFIERLNRGEKPEVEDHARRYPQITAILRQVLPALQLMRTLPDDADSRGVSDPAPEDVTGVLGDYRIIREIGRGGMGVVYEAEQVSLGRRVALKVLPFAAVLDAKQIQRFKNEAHAAAQLHHTNIVPVFSVGCERGVHYYAMQHIEGRTVAELIDELRLVSDSAMVNQRDSATPLSKRATVTSSAISAPTEGSSGDVALPDTTPVAEGSSAALEAIASERSTRSPAFLRSVANLGIQAAKALEHAHELGIVHRDIKPSNLLVDARGNLWITDFGLAHMQSDPGLTMTGDLLGTIRYMSPEQALAKRVPLDHRTDIYSLGVTLYELLTLQPAVAGRDRQELLRRIAFEEPAPPRRLNDVIPTDLETIVLKAISKNPSERYLTAQELADDLRRFLEDKPIQAKRPTLLARATKWSRRHRTMVAAAAVLLVMAVVGLSISTALIWREQAQTKAAEREQSRAREEAEQAREAEKSARAEAEKRADELETVTKFQSSMLSDINAERMGRGIFANLREGIREALDARKTTLDEIDAALATFDASLTGVNATNLALKVIDEQVLARAVETITKQFADQPLVRAALQQTVAETYREIGLYEPAMPLQEAALQTRRRELGNDHPDTLTSINSMGRLLDEMGRNEDAEPYYREALEGRRRMLGDDHPHTLTSINNMGMLLQSMGKYAEAEGYLREGLEGSGRVLGDDHPSTLHSINNMGALLQLMGKYAEAEGYFREALEGYRRVLGDDNQNTLNSINNMGSLLQSMGKLAEAKSYYREALEGRRRVLGDDHPDTLGSIDNMGVLLQSMGKLEQAEPYFREALESRRRVLGDDHQKTLISINNMGILLKSMGKYDEAMPYYHEVLEGCRRALGDDHPNTLGSINNMGDLLVSMGNFAEAEPFHRQSLEGYHRVLGDDHPNTLASINNMGNLLRSMGKLTEAEGYTREALEGCRRVLGDDHPNTLFSIDNMGVLLLSMGKLAEAEPYFREALEGRRRVLGDDHLDTLTSINNMGYLLLSMGKPAEAEPYHRQSLEGCRRVLGDDHPHTLNSINNVGYLLQSMGKLTDAEGYYREALEGRRRVLGNDHPDTIQSIDNMGSLLELMGKPAEAEPLFREVFEAQQRTRPEGDPAIGSALILLGRNLIKQQKYVEAEPLLRECLNIRQEALPEGHWLIFNTQSVFGASLAGQAKFDEAEPLLLDAYAGLNGKPEAIPAAVRAQRLGEALQRIVDLYEACDKPEEAAEWGARPAADTPEPGADHGGGD